MMSFAKNEKSKILIIDDIQDNLIILQALIKETFPETFIFQSLTGIKGLEIAEQEDPDVILLDIDMPGMNGFEVCRKLKEDKKLKEIPVVFITAIRGDKKSRIKALECGAEAFLAKPIDKYELTAQIKLMIKIRNSNKLKLDENTRLAELVEEKTKELKKANDKTLELYEAIKKDNLSRKKTESTLIEAQRLSHIASFEHDVLNNNIVWTEEALNIFGIDSTESIKTVEMVFMFIHPDDKERVLNSNQQAIVEKREDCCCYRLIRKNGEERTVELHFTPAFDQNGRLSRCIGTVQDITERTREHAKLEEALKFNQAIFNSANSGIIVYDTALRYKMWNPFMEQLSGFSSNQVIGRKAEEVFPWLKETGVNSNLEKALEGKPLDENDFYFNITENNKSGWVREHNGPLYNQNGDIVGVLGIVQDISERKIAEDLLKDSEEKYRSLYTSMGQGMALHEIITDADGKPIDYVFLDINDSYTRLLGVTREMCIGKKITEVMPKVEQYWIDIFGKVALTGEASYYENYLETTGGYYSTYTYSPKNRQFAVLVSDITAQKKHEEQLKYLSYHDQLTGLYNRRFFEEELRRLDTKRNLPLSIIMGDINGLKIINDSFGHAIGDKYLKKMAEIIKETCRADEIVARLGGDEFAVILPNADTFKTVKLIDRIKGKLLKSKVGNIELSVSFGFDTKQSEDQSVLETVVIAENHMYAHKIYERASMRSKTIEIIMNALFEKSNRELLHSKRVSAICEAIASNMNFSKDDVNQIRIAGLVHDIGKIGIREEILNKNGSLEHDELEEIKRHPEAGWRILTTIAEFSAVSEFVLRHHEKCDGAGYPNGLEGEEIPIEARIIAVADAFDAMTSERSYRKPVSIDVARAEISVNSGKQFDSMVVEVFLNRVLPNIDNIIDNK